MFKYIVLRREIKLNEYRVPLVPLDCKKLIERNIIVYVEKSNNTRCYSDIEYLQNGCNLIETYTSLPYNKDEMLIVGLKELENIHNIYSYNHLYFSHTFKNQTNSREILNRFKSSGGTIYDLEYFTDDNNKRLFAFGYYAGIAGCYLGLLQYYYKSQLLSINNIMPFKSLKLLFEHIKKEKSYVYIQPSIAIIGNGRCAAGCIALLNQLHLSHKVFTRGTILDYSILSRYNIILNCILIDSKIDPFITNETIDRFTNTRVIVDISCDYNNIYNPLPIYNYSSTFIDPIIKINDTMDIISIDNLPTLLPRESSSAFSSKLVEIIISNDKNVWDKVRNIFLDKIIS